MSEIKIWYVHRPLGEPLRAIGGTARMLREGRLDTPDGEILYIVGGARLDTSCCGVGGCGYALVQGFVRRWKVNETADGYPMSEIELIADPGQRANLRALLLERERVQQVSFRQ